MTGPDMIVTASLTTGVARAVRGIAASKHLIDQVLRMDHAEWETILYIGDVEFHTTTRGPFPNHQLRVSVQPSTGFAALNYMDHQDPHMSIANSYNAKRPLPEVRLIFNGSIGSIFPRSAAIPIASTRQALDEWLATRKRPTCIEWRPFDVYETELPYAGDRRSDLRAY
jgi:hypothetical protein